MSFEETWERIKAETNLKKFSELANLVGTTNQYVSKKRKTDSFPVDWAYIVASRYGLLTEWIMKGSGPRRLHEPIKLRNFQLLNDLEEWIELEIQNNPKKKDWFEVEIEELFPAFRAWREEKKGTETQGKDIPVSKVA